MAAPFWVRSALLVLTAVFLIGVFSPAINDSDFWWHLKTGEYIASVHSLPVPDPFAWTTVKVPPASPAEARTRTFNLTHEWMAQVLLYEVWRFAGFSGIVILRSVSMALVCALVGLICARRSTTFAGGILGALACAAVLAPFAVDRPYQATFLFLALTLAALELRRYVWGLPVLFAIWANCHGGFFLGLIALAAYVAESLWRRERDRGLWAVTAACVAASAINPNGLGVFQTLVQYRTSYMQSRLLEWARPSPWPPAPFSVLLAAALAFMLWQHRRTRLADWILWAAFTAAAAAALRNTAFVGIIAPVLIAGVWPWRRPVPPSLYTLAPPALIAAIVALPIAGGYFDFHATEWKYPAGAARFLKDHHVTAPMFNTYEHGGYLIWRFAPAQRVFIDGRALSDPLFMDYARILYNHDDNDGQPSGEQLLDRYGVEAIVMNTFEPVTGAVYVLAPALADPAQKTWKLVYHDPQSLVFMRNPPAGVMPLNSLEVLDHMEAECNLHLAREPQYPACARALAGVFQKVGDQTRAIRWLNR